MIEFLGEHESVRYSLEHADIIQNDEISDSL
jgi:hypothetical protein